MMKLELYHKSHSISFWFAVDEADRVNAVFLLEANDSSLSGTVVAGGTCLPDRWFCLGLGLSARL